MPLEKLTDVSGLRPFLPISVFSHWTWGSLAKAGSLVSLAPLLSSHQPSPAEPSPPSFSLLMNDAPAQVWGMNRYLADAFMPFWAASFTICVHCVPASIEIHTSGLAAASVVIGSVTVGAAASIVSLT